MLVVAAGRGEEPRQFAEVAKQLARAMPELEVRLASLTSLASLADASESSSWPLLGRLSAVDLIFGGGGYNTTHEAAALQIPHLGVAFPRQYDRQERRLRQLGCSVIAPALWESLWRGNAEAVRRIVTEIRQQLAASSARELRLDASRDPARYLNGQPNGVHAAVEAILAAERR